MHHQQYHLITYLFMNLRWKSDRTQSLMKLFLYYTFFTWFRNTVSSYHRFVIEQLESISGFPFSNSDSRFATDCLCFYSLYINIKFTLCSYYFYLCYFIFQYSRSSSSLSSSPSDSSSSSSSEATRFFFFSSACSRINSQESSSSGKGLTSYSFAYYYDQSGFRIRLVLSGSTDEIQSTSSTRFLFPVSSYYIISISPFFFLFASASLLSNYDLKSFYFSSSTEPCPHCLYLSFKQPGKSLAEYERVGTQPLPTLSLSPQAAFHVGRCAVVINI